MAKRMHDCCCDGNAKVSTAYSLSTAMKAACGTRGVIECKVALVCGCLIHIAFRFNLRLIAVCLFSYCFLLLFLIYLCQCNDIMGCSAFNTTENMMRKAKHGFLTRKSLLVKHFSLVIPYPCVF